VRRLYGSGGGGNWQHILFPSSCVEHRAGGGRCGGHGTTRRRRSAGAIATMVAGAVEDQVVPGRQQF
jgi:hypothetical protein